MRSFAKHNDRSPYGLEILTVREIIRLMHITRVPRSPEFIRGVINLRGKVIPVLDLRIKFEMPPTEATEQTVIIVVNCERAGRALTMGLLADEVLEVLSIGADHIEPPPDFGGATSITEFILGVGRTAEHVTFLLDIAHVLGLDDAAHVAKIADS